MIIFLISGGFFDSDGDGMTDDVDDDDDNDGLLDTGECNPDFRNLRNIHTIEKYPTASLTIRKT